jgi:tetratricopeptide (TPR) repeat protein
MSQIAQYVQQLPYEEPLRQVYVHILIAHMGYREPDQVLKWAAIVEQKAIRHRDLRALGTAYMAKGNTLRHRGDLYGSIPHLQKCLELVTRIGDVKHRGESWLYLSVPFLWVGDLERARFCANRAVEDNELTGSAYRLAESYGRLGQILLAQSEWQQAADLLRKACKVGQESQVWTIGLFAAALQGYALLAGGKQQAALRQFKETMVLAETLPVTESISVPNLIRSPDPPHFAFLLNGLEEAYGDPQAFRETCHLVRREHPDKLDFLLQQWYLELVDARMNPGRLVQELPLQSPDWTWVDLFGDCSYVADHGLEIHAVNGRDLWYVNWSAPRFMRMQAGDLTIQAVCSPVSDDRPAIGGLVLWKDEKNYLHLDWGVFGRHAITFMGCVDNKDVAVGRGRLYEEFERVYLRLERVGDRVNALCSADGEQWYTVGHAAFPVRDPVQAGIHAIGTINRTIYHGAYPEGTAIRFESFQMWEL